MLALLLFLVFAAACAALSCAYHAALISKRAATAANLGVLIDMLQVAPVLFALHYGAEESMTAFIGDWIGGWIGVYCGVRWGPAILGYWSRLRGRSAQGSSDS